MRTLTLVACWLLCGAGCVKTDAPCQPTYVKQLQFVPVPPEFTAPLTVKEREDGTVGAYQDQAEVNTATLRQCNIDRANVATLKPPEN